MDGILLLNKEIGKSSFQAINQAKRIIKASKVGHSGTLDPFADGLLLVSVNKATKVNQFMEVLDKEYIATLKLGEKTSTLDIEGEVIETKSVPPLDSNKIKEVFKSLEGKISQVPPMFSALKVDGKRLYDLAREGIEVERKAREIEIYSLDLIEFNDNLIIFKCHCSKGTYIRSLGETIAEKLETVGHLISLRRTKVGNFSLDDAYSIKDLEKGNYSLKPIIETLEHFQKIILDDKGVLKAKNGLTFIFKNVANEVLLVDKENTPIAVYQKDGNIYRSKRGLF